MKLASLNHGKDGHLVVVHPHLHTCADATHIAPTLQHALDHWDHTAPQLHEPYKALTAGTCPSHPLQPQQCMAPLPRSYAWLDGSAYVKHVELVRQARGATLPDTFWTDPLMYQGHSTFTAPTASLEARTEQDGLDFEAEVAVIMKEVPEGTPKEDALSYVALIVLINDTTLRGLTAPELAKGFGFVQSKPPCAMSPIAITPEELGTHWKQGSITLPLVTQLNGSIFGSPLVSKDMTFNFADLIAHACKTRPLEAGTVIGSGTIANIGDNVGSSCIAEQRMLETLSQGKPATPWLKKGDTVRIFMEKDDQLLFGEIHQKIV